MRTKEVINPEFKTEKDLYDDLIRVKMKLLMEYRGMNQDQLSQFCNKKSQNASSRWMTQNSKYKTSPNAPELLAMCSLLRIHISYFFDEKITCEQADMNITPSKNFNSDEKGINCVTTSVIQNISRALNQIWKKNKTGFILTASNNGSSTALMKFARNNDNYKYYPDFSAYLREDYSEVTETRNDNKIFLIFDESDKFSPSILKEIFEEKHLKLGFPIAFLGKKPLQNIETDYYFKIGPLIQEDIQHFMDTAFPLKDKIDKTLMCARLVGGIDEIISYIDKKNQ